MNYLTPLRHLLALLTAAVFVSPGCKDPELIGLEVLPDDEGYPVAWVDTFTIVASTILDDSVITSNNTSYLFGEMNDPEFGVSKAALFTQFRLPSTSLSFPSGSQIDSVVLNIAYSGAYGSIDKFSGTQSLGVYRLEGALDDTATYYSNRTASHPNLPATYLPTPLAQITFRPDFASNVVSGKDTLPPSLRIKLDPAFGQELLSADAATLADNPAFLQAFKGLAIIPENTALAHGQGAILYFNVVTASTRLEVHYHSAENDSLRTLFPIDAASATHSHYDRKLLPNINAIIGDTLAGMDKLYTQSMGGLRIKLKIPHLKKLKELGIVAINRAEIVLPLADGDLSKYGAPLSMEIYAATSDNSQVRIVDYGDNLLDNAYRPTTNSYNLNIVRHIQAIINQPDSEPDYGLYIYNTGRSLNARRGIYNGTAHPEKPLKIRLTYTIIK